MAGSPLGFLPVDLQSSIYENSAKALASVRLQIQAVVTDVEGPPAGGALHTDLAA